MTVAHFAYSCNMIAKGERVDSSMKPRIFNVGDSRMVIDLGVIIYVFPWSAPNLIASDFEGLYLEAILRQSCTNSLGA